MGAEPEDVLRALADLGAAATTHRHPPLATVAESKALRGLLPGAHTKNLFLEDRKGAFWLVVALEDRKIDFKQLRTALGSAALSFASAERLRQILDVAPGSVTPLAAINDRDGMVTVALDRGLFEDAFVNVHPLVNDRTTALAPDDLVRFLEAYGHPPRIVDL